MKGLKSSGRWPSGNVRYYYRHATPAIPMPDAPKDAPEFLRAYADAAAGRPTRARGRDHHRTGTIGAAIRAFLASDAFLARAASTRDQWGRFAAEAETFFGRARLADLEARHIRKHLSSLAAHPANNRMKLWRAMGRWWVDAGLIEHDPARDLRKRATPQTGGHTPWTACDVRAFRARWPVGTPQRLAFELLHQTGASIGDAVALGPGNLRPGGWLTYRRAKSRTVCTVPLFVPAPPRWYPDSAALRACLDAAPRHLTWMTTARGGARSRKAAGQWFSSAARAAGIEGKSAHGVRKYLATHMAEAGATEAQRMAILGHDTTAQTREYSRTADARRIISGTDFDNSPEPVVKTREK